MSNPHPFTTLCNGYAHCAMSRAKNISAKNSNFKEDDSILFVCLINKFMVQSHQRYHSIPKDAILIIFTEKYHPTILSSTEVCHPTILSSTEVYHPTILSST